jgi:hypothetical protein
MSITLLCRRLWQQRGSSDVHIKLLWCLHLAMTGLTWLQLDVWQENGSNNFKIFKYSFFHLIHQQPLYTTGSGDHLDLFQYHSVFALLFAPIAVLPAPIDLFMWLFGSTIAFLWTITRLGLDKRLVVWITLLSLFELSKNILYAQTNIIATTVMMLSFIFFERQEPTKAAFSSVLNFCIKGFGGITGLLAVLYPKSYRSIAYGIGFLFLMSLTPLCVLTPSDLLQDYMDWFNLLRSDVVIEPYALVSFLTQTLHLPQGIEPFVMFFGAVMLLVYWLLLFLSRHDLTTEQRAYFLSFLLLWVVVFNRAAESATYIMAATGLLIWFFFHKQAGTATKKMTFFFAFCFYWIAVNCSDLSIPYFRAFDKVYLLRPLFALLPMFWMLTDAFRFFMEKTLKTKIQLLSMR